MSLLTEDQPKVYNHQEFQNEVASTLEHLYTVLSRSYGPLGENAIIHRNGSLPTVTKDGLTILKAIRFDSRIEFDVYQLIRTISSNLVDKVGDGSTSAVISAVNLFKALRELRGSYRFAKEFEKELKVVQATLQSIIRTFLTKKSDSLTEQERLDVLTHIATVSNNNDSDIGGQLASVMMKVNATSIVSIKDNPHDNSPPITYTLTSGFNIDNSFRLAHTVWFSASMKRQTGFELDNAIVIMTYNFLEAHYNFLLDNVVNPKKPLPIVVIAETIQPEVLAQVVKDTLVAGDKTPQFTIVETGSLNNENAINRFIDLESYLSCNGSLFDNIGKEGFADMELLKTTIGFAERVAFYPNSTMRFDNGQGFRTGSEQFLTRVKFIQQELDNTARGQKIQRGSLRLRLNRMHGTNATIYVGGRTQEEKTAARYLVEDAVLACQSVIRSGYTMGGNMSTYYAAVILKKIISDKDAFSLNEDILIEDRDAILTLLGGYDGSSTLEKMVDLILSAYDNTRKLPYEVHGLDPIPMPDMSQLKMSYNREYMIHNTFTDRPEAFYTGNTSGKCATSVISPVDTDHEIINAAFSIVTLLLTTNQYIR